MSPSAMRPALRYPSDLRFTCTRCGECCRGWNVMLAPSEKERLAQLDWSGTVPRLAGVAPSNKRHGRDILARGEDDACVYLGPNKECLIHAHFGEEVKPLMCRLYPFGFVPVGAEVAVDVSFACRGIVEENGAPLEEHEPEWVKLAGGVAERHTEHRFSKRYVVDGELLWELEHGIVTLLSDRSVSVARRVSEISQFLRLAMSGDPRTEAARKLRSIMLTGVPRQMRAVELPEREMDPTERAVFFQLLYVFLNPPPDAFHDLKGKARARELERRVMASKLYERPDARPHVDNREIGATFEEVERVSPGFLEDASGRRFVERYLSAKIIGQRFLAEDEGKQPFVLAVHRLLLLYPMLLWTAKALAADSGGSEVSAKASRRAVRLIDRSYGVVRFADLPAKQRKAWEATIVDAELAVVATSELSRFE